MTTRPLNNHSSPSIDMVDFTVGLDETDQILLDLIIAQRTDSYVYQSYSV